MKISELPPEQMQRVRRYNRDAKREQRKRERLERDQRILADGDFRSAERMNESGKKERVALGVVFFGEVSPDIDAATVQDALQVCREFADALSQSDIQGGESLEQFETRIGRVWCEQGGPFLNRAKRKLYKGWGSGYWTNRPFLEIYNFLPGAAKPVDVSTLPALPPISEEPQQPQQSKPELSDAEIGEKALERGRVQFAQQLYGVPADAVRYLSGDHR